MIDRYEFFYQIDSYFIKKLLDLLFASYFKNISLFYEAEFDKRLD